MNVWMTQRGCSTLRLHNLGRSDIVTLTVLPSMMVKPIILTLDGARLDRTLGGGGLSLWHTLIEVSLCLLEDENCCCDLLKH
jgi:hypothetical protein